MPASGADCPSTDQRGGARPKGGACDIGAFEADPVAVPGGGTIPPAVSDTIAPAVTRFAVSSHRIRRGGRGTRVSYIVSEAGTATFTVKRVVRGKRLATVGSLSRRSLEGVNRFTFTGRIKGKLLKPGSYKLVLVVKDVAGNASKPKVVGFKVVG